MGSFSTKFSPLVGTLLRICRDVKGLTHERKENSFGM